MLPHLDMINSLDKLQVKNQSHFKHKLTIVEGTVRGLRFENGTQLSMDAIINEQLQDDAHIWIILKGIEFVVNEILKVFLEDIEAITESKKAKQLVSPNAKLRTTITGKKN